MKIQEVEVIPFCIPCTYPIRISAGVMEAVQNVLVRITTDTGVVGLGETQPLPSLQGCSETQASVEKVIREAYVPLLLGRSPIHIGRILQDLDGAARGNYPAVSAVGDALYDLLARALGVPLYVLLGGLHRDRIEMVWSVGMKGTEEMVSEARDAMDRGYRKLKIKVGAPDVDEDVEHAFAVRRAIGEKTSFRIDANGGLTLAGAMNLLKALKEVHLEFAEQPLPLWDYDGMSQLSLLSRVPIMADESCHSAHSAMELVKKQAAAIFDIKLMKNGGIHNARTVAAVARAANIPVYAGGNVGSSIGAATAAHFYAATLGVIAGDFNLGPGGWLTGDLVREPLHTEGAFVFVPDGPGIGVDLDEARLADCAV